MEVNVAAIAGLSGGEREVSKECADMKGFGMMARKGVIIACLLVLAGAIVATGMTFDRWLDAQRAIRGVSTSMLSFQGDLEDPQRFSVELMFTNLSDEPIVLQHVFSRLYHERQLIATLDLTHQEQTLEPGLETVYDLSYVTRLGTENLPAIDARRQPEQWRVEMWLKVEHAGYRGSFQFPARAEYKP